jgi:hypothetical protein
MQIAAYRPAASPPAPSDIEEYRPGQNLPDFPVDDNPVAKLMREHVYDYLAMPGAVSVAWQPTDPTWFQVNFRDEAQRATAARILEPVVQGVALRFERSTWAGGSEAPDASPFAYRDAITAVASLPGVWYQREQASQIDQDGQAVFFAISESKRRQLDKIVRDRFDGLTRPDGTVKQYSVEWVVPALPPE